MTGFRDGILAADIGGTNARFACLTQNVNGGWDIDGFQKLAVVDFPKFDDAIAHYLSSLSARPQYASFAVAGTVIDNSVNLTNNEWVISGANTESTFGFERCEIINDFAGMTRSIPELPGDAFEAVRGHSADPRAPILVAGPGTGFGVGYLVPAKSGWYVVSTEGGHMAYAPQTEIEFKVLQNLSKKFSFVSLELVSSGKGLPVLHRAVSEIFGHDYELLHPDEIRKRADASDPICSHVCDIRAAAVMGAIGDLALAGGARGGIVLAGGVSERMLAHFKKPQNMARFLSRGSHSDYLKDISMRLLTSPYAPLIGTAAYFMDG